MLLDISTERLQLRPPQPQDAPQIAAYMADPDLPLNLGRAPYPYRREHAEAWIPLALAAHKDETEYPFMIVHPKDGVVGCCGLTQMGEGVMELGYWAGKPHWGRGYATEASHALIAWGRMAKDASGFVSGHIFDNPASGRVLVKLGFQPVGETSMYVVGRDCEVRAIRYALDAPSEAALAARNHEPKGDAP